MGEGFERWPFPVRQPGPAAEGSTANPHRGELAVFAAAYRVMLDPGHGGKDPGAIGIGGTREKDVVLDVSQVVSPAAKVWS